MLHSVFFLPDNIRSADLLWWRQGGDDGYHTVVTVFAANHALFPEPLALTFVLFDGAGRERARWTMPFPAESVIVVDSARLGDWLSQPPAISDGTLAIFACGQERQRPRPHAGKQLWRLASEVDWYTNDGRLASLHNDQSLLDLDGAGEAGGPQELTEIVVRESADERNSLVIVNGPWSQRSGALTLSLTNQAGDRREITYEPAMAPFTVHRIGLAAGVTDIAEFAAGGHLLIEGRFESRGLFTRPYVFTEGRRFGAYHGGDRYRWPGTPWYAYKLLGEGEINPMAAVHRPDLTTLVNVLHSHGDLDADFWVDARLWDSTGQMVAERRRWLLARRRGLSRGAVRDLLPDPERPFVGHVALTFSSCDTTHYPGRLQALLEYEAADSVSRVMAWSDDWNSGIKHRRMRRAGGDDALLFSYYRAFARPDFTTYLSLTNVGHPGYASPAPYAISPRNTRAEELRIEGCLSAQATRLAPVHHLFPGAAAFLAPVGVGVIVVESPADLAIVQLTRGERRGCWAVEHLMSMPTVLNGGVFYPAAY